MLAARPGVGDPGFPGATATTTPPPRPIPGRARVHRVTDSSAQPRRFGAIALPDEGRWTGSDPDRARREISLLWLSCGDRDGLMRLSRGFHDALEEMKVPHAWHIGSGGHAWPVWKSDLYFLSQRLFK